MTHKIFLASLMIPLLGYTLAVTRQDVAKVLADYDRDEPPPPAGKPTIVSISIYVNSLYLDLKTQQMVWNMYLRQSWNDSRLTSLFDNEDDSLYLGQGQWKNIWYPDLFFRNSLEVVRGSVPAEQVLLRLQQKNLWFVQKLKVTTSISGFRNKLCTLIIESFKYTKDDLELSWLSSPVDFDASISIPNYEIRETILYDCSQNYTAGSFTCLEIRVVFKDHTQETGDTIVSGQRLAFAVGVFLVIVAWFSFWIDGDQVLQRLGILVGVAMTTVLLGIALHLKDDQVYLKTTYIFMAVFIIFVVVAMLEYILVYGFLKFIPSKIKGEKKGDAEEKSSGEKIARIIDLAFGLVIYPVLLVLFIIVYPSVKLI